MKESTDITVNLSVFNSLVSQLMSIGVKIEEEDKALILVNSLPKSFKNLVTTLCYGRDDLDIDTVVRALLSDEMRKKTNKEASSSSEALVSRGRMVERGKDRSSSRSKSKGKKTKVRCWYYNKIGNI